MKNLVILLIINIFVLARENPFVTVTQESGVVNTEPREDMMLDVVTVPFPDTARTIKKVTIEYTNIDGSIDTRELDMNVSIDWHKPLLLTQKLETATISQKELLDKPIATVPMEPIISSTDTTIHKLNQYVSYQLIDNGYVIYTKDKLIRDFALPKPFKIALDFKSDTYANTIEKEIGDKYKKISFGSHRGFYRVVFELDGRYTYKLNKNDDSIVVMLK